MKINNVLLILFAAFFVRTGLKPVLAKPGVDADLKNGLTAEKILDKADAVAKSDSSKGIMETIIITTSGAERTLVSEAFSKDGQDKQLTRYIKPARVKGESMLMLNDGNDIWYYSPRTDRVRKIASHAKKKKVMGSDFTYEDMASGTMARKYTGELLGIVKQAKKKCFHLELIPTPAGPSYAKIQTWIDQATFVMLRVDYWDKGEKPFKRLILSEVKNIDGHLTHDDYTLIASEFFFF